MAKRIDSYSPLPPTYARVARDGIVHLVAGWVAFDLKTNTYEEALCAMFKSYGPPLARSTEQVTCVACMAKWMMTPQATVV